MVTIYSRVVIIKSLVKKLAHFYKWNILRRYILQSTPQVKTYIHFYLSLCLIDDAKTWKTMEWDQKDSIP